MEKSKKKLKISREQDKATQNCESCGVRHGIDKEILICSGCCWVGYCSFTCQKNDWRKHKKSCLHKHKKSCLRKTNVHRSKRAKLVIAKDGSGSDLMKASIVESKIGKIVKMIAPAHEEQGSQTLHIHMHCPVWLMQLAIRVPQSLFQVDSIKQVKSTRFWPTSVQQDSIKQVKSTRFWPTSVQQEMAVLSIQHIRKHQRFKPTLCEQ